MKIELTFSMLFFGSLVHAASITVCVKAREFGINTTLSGANVVCLDEDSLDPINDDTLTVTPGTTDGNGCATLTYVKKTPSLFASGWDPTWACFGIIKCTNPDIYCKVTKTNMATLYTNTKRDHDQKTVANFGTVVTFPNRTARGDPGTAGKAYGCGPASAWPALLELATYLPGDFNDECNNHDRCYNDCSETKKSCDEEFRDLMYSECNRYWETYAGEQGCKTVAKGKYEFVRDDPTWNNTFNAARTSRDCPVPP